MLFDLWHYLIIILLTVQVAKARVTVSPTCGTLTGAVQDAVAEAIAIAGWAHARTAGLRDGALTLPDWRVTLNTFNTYFGVLGAPGALTGQNGEFIALDAITT